MTSDGNRHIEQCSRGWLFGPQDLVYLKVEESVYCAPKPRLAALSLVFQDMFGIPQDSDSVVEGASYDTPIVLPGCSKAEFEPFLDCILSPKIPMDNTSSDDWLSILRLATMWQMAEVRKMAILYVSPLVMLHRTPLEKIRLGKAHHVASWLIEGYAHYAEGGYESIESLAHELGWQTAARIAQAAHLASESAKSEPLQIPVGSVMRAPRNVLRSRGPGVVTTSPPRQVTNYRNIELVLRLEWEPGLVGEVPPWVVGINRRMGGKDVQVQEYEVVLTPLIDRIRAKNYHSIVQGVFAEELRGMF